jgi:hypothetical protein
MRGNMLNLKSYHLFRDPDASLCESYCEYLRSFGIQAVLLDKESPEQIPHTFWEWIPGKKLGSIKIEGKNFQEFVLWRYDTKGGPRYLQHFIVRATVGENEENLNARQIRPLFNSKKKPQEFTWKGGVLAETLNSDMDLMERLKLLPLHIHVTAKKKFQYVCIENRTILKRNDYPHIDLLEIIDRIANHVRRMAPPSL